MADRMDVIVVGRKFGTASGWDRVADEILCFYDFEPAPDLPPAHFQPGLLQIDFENGIVETVVDDEVIGRKDLVYLAMIISPEKEFEIV